MKVKTLWNMLQEHNLDAEIVFKSSKSGLVSISSKADCKCKEKEIYISIGKKCLK